MDSKRFKKKYFLGVLGSNITLLPFATGAICSMGYLVFENTPLALVGVFGILAGVGTFVYRFLVSPSEKIARKAQEEIEREDNEAREADLDGLQVKLRRTKGTSDEDAFRDLRALVDAFRKSQTWKNSVNAQSVFEIVSTVDQIFNECINKLKATLEIYYDAEKTPSDKIRQSLLKRRDKVIKSVQKSVEQLNNIFGEIQEIGLSSGNQDVKLSRLGKDLLENLELAKEADKIEKSLSEGHSVDEILKEQE